MPEVNRRPVPGAVRTAAVVQPETFDSYAAYWASPASSLVWPGPFMLPPWLAAWWATFGQDHAPYLLSIRREEGLAGLVPLMRRGREVRLMGDTDLCDHMDVVVAPSTAREGCARLLDYLAADGIERLVLPSVREDAAAMTDLRPAAEDWGARVRCEPRGRLFAMHLPRSWEDYLMRLSGKERHEIRRKLRRLDSAGRVTRRCVRTTAELPAAMETFMTLFRANRADKAAFMHGPMPTFFYRLAANMAAAGRLRLYFLELDDRAIAATLCFVHGDTVYLYNNGYDDAYRTLSPGLLGKVFTIRAGIEAGCRVYDFLKGDEKYKQRLGGAPVNLYRIAVEWGTRGKTT